MQPACRPGDVLVGRRWGRPRPGQLVVVHQAGRPLIKRLIRATPAGLWVEGDNAAASTDSRQFGPLPWSSLEAVIVTRKSW